MRTLCSASKPIIGVICAENLQQLDGHRQGLNCLFCVVYTEANVLVYASNASLAEIGTGGVILLVKVENC